MSAYEEFAREQRDIDELLFRGYTIKAIEENLDGAIVKFAGAEPSLATAELVLLTADARKYVTSLLIANG
ncbi:hypothetical protein [Paenibacillus sp. sgz500958]|uniref:hypothetical protein n=1 Tax=Paenibacillus sp. sgz500958 TaxID=3242475 RepID=UPI0036D34135